MSWFRPSLILLAACGGAKQPTSAAPSLAHALSATLAAASREPAPWRCVAEDLPELALATIGEWQVAQHSLVHKSAKDVVIGVIADAGGADPKTIAALGRIRAKLDEAHADLVIALGGMGTTQPELEATLGVLAKPTSPVIALPGDLEAVAAETAAIAVLTAKGAPVFDGRLVRWIELPDATIGTIAGAGSPLRLASNDGCVWRAEDVVQLYKDLEAKPGLRIAALSESPREGDSGELDLAPPAIDLVLHGPTHPSASAAQAGGRDGTHVGLSPGTADATPRLSNQTHSPSAGLLTLRGSAWSWKPLVDKPSAVP